MRNATRRIVFLAAFLAAVGAGPAAWADLTLSYTGTVQTYTVDQTGTYQITVSGAQGGPSTSSTGGLGAVISGDITLTAGEVLEVVVGGQGKTGNILGQFGGGAGGGSFVYISGASSPLIVAGGGGAGFALFNNGGPGQTGTAGQNGFGSSGLPAARTAPTAAAVPPPTPTAAAAAAGPVMVPLAPALALLRAEAASVRRRSPVARALPEAPPRRVAASAAAAAAIRAAAAAAAIRAAAAVMVPVPCSAAAAAGRTTTCCSPAWFTTGTNSGNGSVAFEPVSVSAVPEPSTLVYDGTAALIGLGFAWRRRKANPAA